MSTLFKSAAFCAVIACISQLTFGAGIEKTGGSTGLTQLASAHGIPYGSSSDPEFLPWLKPTDDPEYGYSQEKPVEIGGFLEGRGNDWPAQYFSSLLGANGEPTTFERVKSCCRFEVVNPKIVEAGIKVGFLDEFKVTIKGQKPAYIYVTLYTEGEIFAPKGFTIRRKAD